MAGTKIRAGTRSGDGEVSPLLYNGREYLTGSSVAVRFSDSGGKGALFKAFPKVISPLFFPLHASV